MKIWLWVTLLAITSWLYGMIIDQIVTGASTSTGDKAAASLAYVLIVFGGSGLVAGITYAITRNKSRSMWVWTVVMFAAMTILSIGLVKIMSL